LGIDVNILVVSSLRNRNAKNTKRLGRMTQCITKKGWKSILGLGKWPLLLLWIFCANIMTIAWAEEAADYRYDFMWPQIAQPWYFSFPDDVAVAPDGSVYVADTFNHRIQRFGATGTFLSAWGTQGSEAGEFKNPNGIAVTPDGLVLVADSGNHRIQQFSAEGLLIRTWGSEGRAMGQFRHPSHVAVASDGTVYVVDRSNHRIQRFSAEGLFLTTWGSEGHEEGQFSSPAGIAVATDGTLYVADFYNNRIQQFSAGGVFLRAWGREGSEYGQFDNPSGIAVAPDGTVYVVDFQNNRIQRFSPTGVFMQAWGNQGKHNGQFNQPGGIAAAPDGTVYIADIWNHRIQQFSAEGAFINTIGSMGIEGGRFDWPFGIVVSPDGAVYVADTDNDRVQQFSATGDSIRTWGGEGDERGQFNRPIGIAVAFDGSLVVADTDNHRIQRFQTEIAVSPDGTLYVIDTWNHRIQQFNMMGEFIRTWGSQGSAEGEFDYPSSIVVAPDGTVLVTDRENHRVQQFSSSGTFIRSWGEKGNAEGDLYQPSAIAVTPNGTLFIAEWGNHRIQHFSATGAYLGTVGRFGSAAGEFIGPSSISVTATGRLYVADTYNNRIQVFRRTERAAKTPKALIIAGRTAVGDALDPQAQSLMIRQVYGSLKAQGYMSDASHDDLRVLWNGESVQLDANSEVATGVASHAGLAAVQDWASSAERLVLYLIGHGIEGAFYLNAVEGEQELLGAGELDDWLDRVQTGLSDDLTLIVEACHAGSFLAPLQDENRLLLASAGAEERALFGYHGINSYSYQFWLELGAGHDLKTAHENASKRLEGQSTQTPLLDANANAIGNEREDLAQSLDRCLGIEVNEEGKLVRGCKGYLSPPPQIEAIAADRDLYGEQSAELWLRVNLLLADNINDAWALLTRPDAGSDARQAFDRLPVITLQRDDAQPERWQATYAPGGKNRQGETYQGFDVQGDYQLAYYVRNKDGLMSAPLLGEITQTQGEPVTPPPPPVSGASVKLINLSTRGQINAGDGAMVGGFVLQGSEPQQILIKGIGPSLSAAGLSGVLSDPELTLHRNGNEIARNDDWENGAQPSQIRSLNPPANAKEPALLLTLDPGVYTATVSGKNGATGIGMVEINVIGESESTLVNLSTRGQINAGDGAMVGGFVLQGAASKQVLIKGVGPVLSDAGIAGALSDPQLTLHAGGVEIAHNDDWQDSAQSAQISATHRQPANDKEPAILATLSPGAYTATVSGGNGATGIGMVEVYVLE
jgi:tripartite motif-containing protein 71